ncbi:hypothetical protein EDC01DRAFT_783416 [Geopyxis carbonaria]|nr:hypothetical protein EDC01DRAFT_783416 [Geopyxis carbonaria]
MHEPASPVPSTNASAAPCPPPVPAPAPRQPANEVSAVQYTNHIPTSPQQHTAMTFTPNSIISHSANNIDDFLHGSAAAAPTPQPPTMPTPPAPGSGGGDIADARRTTTPDARPAPPSRTSHQRTQSIDIATLRLPTAGTGLGGAVTNSHPASPAAETAETAKTAEIDLGDGVKLEPITPRRSPPGTVKAVGIKTLEDGKGAGNVGGLPVPPPALGAPAAPRYTRGGWRKPGAQDARYRAGRMDARTAGLGERAERKNGGGGGAGSG